MPEIGWAGLGVVPEVDSKFYSKLERDIDPALSRVGKSSGSRFGSILGKSAAVAAGGAVAAGFAAFKLGKDSVQAASDLNESLNAVNVTYGKQAEFIQALGNSAKTNFGLSNAEFNEFAVQFSAFAKTIGGEGFGVVRTMSDLTHRVADFASVMNLDVNEAAQLFQSGLAGETEPLRRYGLDLSAAAVEAHALAEGIADSKGELTESEKVQARYSLLMKQTSKTQDDFANTSDSLANRQRILSASWEDARAKLGTALLPMLEDATGFLLDEGIPAFEKFSDWFADEGVDGLKRFGNFTKDEVIPVVKDLAGFLGDAAEVGEDVVKFINDLPGPAKIAGLTALVGGVGAAKLRGGKGALGSVGSALGLSKPVPVFVTNPGFGTPGVDGKTPVVGGSPASTKAGRLKSVARAGSKAFLPATLFLAGREVGGDEFGEGGRRPSITGSGSETLIEQINRVKDEAETIPDSFRSVLDQTAAAFKAADIPAELKTQVALYGVPESMRAARELVAQYDLTPREKRTLFDVLGFDRTIDRIERLNAKLDWAARPREARLRITETYAAAGYETKGGLQAGSGIGADRRRALGGFN